MKDEKRKRERERVPVIESLVCKKLFGGEGKPLFCRRRKTIVVYSLS
jgi:hypothetical protein